MRIFVFVFSLIFLAACSTPPQPPTVDGSDRQPINSAATIAKLEAMANPAGARQKTTAAAIPFKTPSKVVSITSTAKSDVFSPTKTEQYQIRELIATAKHIEVRGISAAKLSTDAAAIVIAKKRAINAGLFLINNGAKSSLIALEYKAVPVSKSTNFDKVEIEFFTQ